MANTLWIYIIINIIIIIITNFNSEFRLAEAVCHSQVNLISETNLKYILENYLQLKQIVWL